MFRIYFARNTLVAILVALSASLALAQQLTEQQARRQAEHKWQAQADKNLEYLRLVRLRLGQDNGIVQMLPWLMFAYAAKCGPDLTPDTIEALGNSQIGMRLAMDASVGETFRSMTGTKTDYTKEEHRAVFAVFSSQNLSCAPEPEVNGRRSMPPVPERLKSTK